jgi:hypothetical protein
MGTAACPNIRSIGIEHSIVMRFPILGKRVHYGLGRFIAIGLKRSQHHSPAAVWHDRALQWRIRLKSHNDFVVLVDVTRRVRGDRARDQRNVEHAFLALLHK